MKEYKLVIKKGNGYFDPQLNININSPHGTKIVTKKDLLNKNISNINFAVKTGVLNMIDMDTKDKVIPNEVKANLTSDDKVEEDNVVEESDEEEEEEDFDEVEQISMDAEEEDEVDELEQFTEDGQPRCQAITASGNQCSNPAIFPEDDPEYCHIDSHQKRYNPDLEDEE